jgi:hypothetical protein
MQTKKQKKHDICHAGPTDTRNINKIRYLQEIGFVSQEPGLTRGQQFVFSRLVFPKPRTITHNRQPPNKKPKSAESVTSSPPPKHQIGFDPQNPPPPQSPDRRTRSSFFPTWSGAPTQNIEKTRDLSHRPTPTHQIGFGPQKPNVAPVSRRQDQEFVFSNLLRQARNKISKKHEICHYAAPMHRGSFFNPNTLCPRDSSKGGPDARST